MMATNFHEANNYNIVKYCSFNQSQDCFTIATDEGIRIFEVKKKLLRELDYLPQVMLWNAKDNEFQTELTLSSKGGSVLNVFMNLTRLVAIQKTKVHVFDLTQDKFLRTEETRPNPHGLGALGGEGAQATLALPFFKTGCVMLILIDHLSETRSMAPNHIDAHKGELAQLAINNAGTLLATGSVQGTVIRIYDTRQHNLITELRRGSDPCSLHCLQFSPCSTYLAVSSDKGTVHVFTVRENSADGVNWKNRIKVFDDARRSIAQYTLSEKIVTRLGFIMEANGECRTFTAVGSDGSYHEFSFNKGICERSAYEKLMELGSGLGFYTQKI